MASSVLATANRRTAGSLAVNAPSLNTGREKRLVVTMGTFSPVASRALRNRLRMASRSDGDRAVGNQVVVVEADAVGAEVGQPVDRVDRVEREAGLVTERVTPGIAHGPQTEGEVVFRRRLEGIGHG